HTGGNLQHFIKMLHSKSFDSTEDYTSLKEDRGYLYEDTLISWEVCRNYLNDRWMIPANDPKGKLANLYQYVRTNKGMKLMPVPGLPHQLFGQVDPDCPDVFILEGPWDAMALWETFRYTKLWNGGYKETGNYN